MELFRFLDLYSMELSLCADHFCGPFVNSPFSLKLLL